MLELLMLYMFKQSILAEKLEAYEYSYSDLYDIEF